MAPSGPEQEATVKWFNPEKGFGFAELSDGTGDAFLHIRAVEATGHSELEPGTKLVVKVAAGQRGPQVTEVVSVDTSTAEPRQARRPGGFGGGAGGGGDRFGGGGGGGAAASAAAGIATAVAAAVAVAADLVAPRGARRIRAHRAKRVPSKTSRAS
jgi:CspA family cold shock protein